MLNNPEPLEEGGGGGEGGRGDNQTNGGGGGGVGERDDRGRRTGRRVSKLMCYLLEQI